MADILSQRQGNTGTRLGRSSRPDWVRLCNVVASYRASYRHDAQPNDEDPVMY